MASEDFLLSETVYWSDNPLNYSKYVNLDQLSESFENLPGDDSGLFKLDAMKEIWTTVPFGGLFPTEWSEIVSGMFQKILKIQKIASTLSLSESEEVQKDMKQIIKATLKVISDLHQHKVSIVMENSISQISDALRNIISLTQFEHADIKKKSFRDVLERILVISIETGTGISDKLLPEGHALRRSIDEISRLCQAEITSGKGCRSTIDKIKQIATDATEALNWPLIDFELFKNATASILDYADVVIRRRVFKECVSRLIDECKVASSEDLSYSEYLKGLFGVLRDDPDSAEEFEKSITEVSKNAKENYVRRELLNFWEKIERETCELFIDASLEHHLTELSEKISGNKTVELVSNRIFGQVKDILEKLSIDELTSRTILRQEFSDARKSICFELNSKNRRLFALTDVFDPCVSEPAQTIRKFLIEANDTIATTPVKLTIFELVVNFMKDFRADESDKKEDISTFLIEIQDFLFKKDGQTENSVILFDKQLNELNQNLNLLAIFYFQKINSSQFRKIWENLDNLAPTTDVENSIVEMTFKDLSKLFIELRPEILRPEKSITQLSDTFAEIAKMYSSAIVIKTITLFISEAKRCLENAFLDEEQDYSGNIFEQIIDVSAHRLETVLKDEVLPRAEFCLFVIKIQLDLLSLDDIFKENSKQRKWSLMEKFQENITADILNGDEVGRITDEINSSIMSYKDLGGDINNIYAVWDCFKKEVDNIFNNNMDRTSRCIKLFHSCVITDINSEFRETCANLIPVKIDEDTMEEAKSILKDYCSLPKMEALDLLEETRLSLTRTSSLLKEKKEIVCYFNDMKSNFDQVDELKCDEWASLLRQIVAKFEEKLKNAPFRNDEQPLLENTMENVSIIIDFKKVYILLTWDIRQILKELGDSHTFKGTDFELKSFLFNIQQLIEKIEKTSINEQMLLRFFSMNTDSENFNHIIEILNKHDSNIDREDAEELRNIMGRVCSEEDKYKAKRRLRNFWRNVKTTVEQEFKKKNPLKWDKLENFRLSLDDKRKIRQNIYALADKNLQRETRLENILYALNNPISYLLLLGKNQKLTLQPRDTLSTVVAFVAAVFMLFVALVMFGWSNVKNMRN